MKQIIALSLALATLAGCATAGGPVTGFWYTDTKGNQSATSNNIDKKKGTSCATSILGLIAMGDASVTTAAKKGRISKISHVDSTHFSLLGVYAENCTVVYGSPVMTTPSAPGAAAAPAAEETPAE